MKIKKLLIPEKLHQIVQTNLTKVRPNWNCVIDSKSARFGAKGPIFVIARSVKTYTERITRVTNAAIIPHQAYIVLVPYKNLFLAVT